MNGHALPIHNGWPDRSKGEPVSVFDMTWTVGREARRQA